MKAKYRVLTWDSEREEYTPQSGVRSGPYTLFGLRKAIRKLRSLGYPCNYLSKEPMLGDPSVCIERIDS